MICLFSSGIYCFSSFLFHDVKQGNCLFLEGSAGVRHVWKHLLCNVPVFCDFDAFETEKVDLPQSSLAWFRFVAEKLGMHCNKVSIGKKIF